MRKSKQETARTRERIVAAAAEDFRKHGIVATGLADLMKSAGLTHGGFYKHFSSKDELVREAAATAMSATTARLREAADRRAGRRGIAEAAAIYLSTAHRDTPGHGCAFAAIGSELARGDAKIRAEATEGFLKFIDVLSSHADGMRPDQAKKRALAAVSTMIGAITMSRMVNDSDLSDAILKTAFDAVLRLFE